MNVAAAASSCENADGLPVVTSSAPFEHDFSGTITIPLAVGASVEFILDIGGATRPVDFEASWGDGVSDYDMLIETAGGSELAYPFEGGAGPERARVTGLKGCVHIVGTIENFTGDPTTPVTLTAELG